jgi:CubicO group peptidase (beta-lactamase class C family)
MRDGLLIYAKGYGFENVESKSHATAETVFRAGSITKMFTAAAIMHLVQDGRVSLDDRVAKYIPELAGTPPVTIRMLLLQTSGLHDYGDTFVDRCRSHTTKELVDFIAAQKPLTDFMPGSHWAYSNSNYFVLGAIIERVSGEPLGSYLAENVIRPAGLGTTAFDRESQIVPHRASGYSPVKNQKGHFLNAECLSPDNAGGAGALRSTAADLARWQQALFAGKVVDKASVAAMTTPGRLNDGTLAVRPDAPISVGPTGYAFGLEVSALDGKQAIGHGGSVPGFTAYLVTFPELRLTVAIMTNGMPQDVDIFHAIERAALHDGQEARR